MVFPELRAERHCDRLATTAVLDPAMTPDPLTTIGSEPTLRRCQSNDTFAAKPGSLRVSVRTYGASADDEVAVELRGVASALC
jgi:hypothetical protein